jgi:hypothetical protein
MEEELDQVHFVMTETVTFTLSEQWCNLCMIVVPLHSFLKLCYVGGKQWQTTPKNLPRMQHTRAIPVT